MKIEYTKEINDTNITLSVQGIEYTDDEIAAFKAFGDPTVHYEQTCKNGQAIDLRKKIYSGLRFSYSFITDPTVDNAIDNTITDALQFIEGFTEAVQNIMQPFMKNYNALLDKFTMDTVTKEIKD